MIAEKDAKDLERRKEINKKKKDKLKVVFCILINVIIWKIFFHFTDLSSHGKSCIFCDLNSLGSVSCCWEKKMTCLSTEIDDGRNYMYVYVKWLPTASSIQML